MRLMLSSLIIPLYVIASTAVGSPLVNNFDPTADPINFFTRSSSAQAANDAISPVVSIVTDPFGPRGVRSASAIASSPVSSTPAITPYHSQTPAHSSPLDVLTSHSSTLTAGRTAPDSPHSFTLTLSHYPSTRPAPPTVTPLTQRPHIETTTRTAETKTHQHSVTRSGPAVGPLVSASVTPPTPLATRPSGHPFVSTTTYPSRAPPSESTTRTAVSPPPSDMRTSATHTPPLDALLDPSLTAITTTRVQRSTATRVPPATPNIGDLLDEETQSVSKSRVHVLRTTTAPGEDGDDDLAPLLTDLSTTRTTVPPLRPPAPGAPRPVVPGPVLPTPPAPGPAAPVATPPPPRPSVLPTAAPPTTTRSPTPPAAPDGGAQPIPVGPAPAHGDTDSGTGDGGNTVAIIAGFAAGLALAAVVMVVVLVTLVAGGCIRSQQPQAAAAVAEPKPPAWVDDRAERSTKASRANPGGTRAARALPGGGGSGCSSSSDTGASDSSSSSSRSSSRSRSRGRGRGSRRAPVTLVAAARATATGAARDTDDDAAASGWLDRDAYSAPSARATAPAATSGLTAASNTSNTSAPRGSGPAGTALAPTARPASRPISAGSHAADAPASSGDGATGAPEPADDAAAATHVVATGGAAGATRASRSGSGAVGVATAAFADGSAGPNAPDAEADPHTPDAVRGAPTSGDDNDNDHNDSGDGHDADDSPHAKVPPAAPIDYRQAAPRASRAASAASASPPTPPHTHVPARAAPAASSSRLAGLVGTAGSPSASLTPSYAVSAGHGDARASVSPPPTAQQRAAAAPADTLQSSTASLHPRSTTPPSIALVRRSAAPLPPSPTFGPSIIPPPPPSSVASSVVSHVAPLPPPADAARDVVMSGRARDAPDPTGRPPQTQQARIVGGVVPVPAAAAASVAWGNVRLADAVLAAAGVPRAAAASPTMGGAASPPRQQPAASPSPFTPSTAAAGWGVPPAVQQQRSSAARAGGSDGAAAFDGAVAYDGAVAFSPSVADTGAAPSPSPQASRGARPASSGGGLGAAAAHSPTRRDPAASPMRWGGGHATAAPASPRLCTLCGLLGCGGPPTCRASRAIVIDDDDVSTVASPEASPHGARGPYRPPFGAVYAAAQASHSPLRGVDDTWPVGQWQRRPPSFAAAHAAPPSPTGGAVGREPSSGGHAGPPLHMSPGWQTSPSPPASPRVSAHPAPLPAVARGAPFAPAAAAPDGGSRNVSPHATDALPQPATASPTRRVMSAAGAVASPAADRASRPSRSPPVLRGGAPAAELPRGAGLLPPPSLAATATPEALPSTQALPSALAAGRLAAPDAPGGSPRRRAATRDSEAAGVAHPADARPIPPTPSSHGDRGKLPAWTSARGADSRSVAEAYATSSVPRTRHLVGSDEPPARGGPGGSPADARAARVASPLRDVDRSGRASAAGYPASRAVSNGSMARTGSATRSSPSAKAGGSMAGGSARGRGGAHDGVLLFEFSSRTAHPRAEPYDRPDDRGAADDVAAPPAVSLFSRAANGSYRSKHT